MLKRRAAIVEQVRRFFRARGYWEADTPCLARDACVDIHIEPIAIPIAALTGSRPGPGAEQVVYLQTSPEFGMKRLLAAGSGSIFQFAHAFRADEIGPLHNPEFTLLEWYKVEATYHDLMGEVSELVQMVAGCKPATKVTYGDAFLEHAAFDPFAISIDDLRRRATELGYHHADADRDDLLNFILAATVEPKLGFDRPLFLYDYPATQAALAKVRAGDPPVAERFELYVNGIELCNGYQELTDAGELRQRNVAANLLRRQAGKRELPVESQLLAVMEQGLLPDCSGVALGFDRLVMLATGAKYIAEVVPFPFGDA